MNDKVTLCDGKYTFRMEDSRLVCDRYDDKEWREFVGDNAVYALFEEVVRLRKLEHLVWHMMDDSEERKDEVAVDAGQAQDVCDLLSEDHPQTE